VTEETKSTRGARIGRLEYVIESRRGKLRERYYVMRADSASVHRYAELGLAVEPGSRVVLEAESLRPVGVLDEPPTPATSPAGYNPYFDLPAA
jgi:hypothetical protein